MRVAKVTGQDVTKNKGSQGNKLVLQLEISSPEDIQSVQLMQSAGENSPPPTGSRVITIPIGTQGYKLAVGVDDGIEPPSAEPGEKKLYSSDGGTVKAVIYLKKDGTISISSGVEDIKTLFDDLIDAIVGIITTGSPTTHTVNAASQAQLNAIKTRFGQLWGAV